MEKEFIDSIEAFVADSVKIPDQKVALVTSGGTCVPLEKHAVRYLENFSTGRRGALSVEQFLTRGYKVIFLYRDGSCFPYLTQMKNNQEKFLKNLIVGRNGRTTIDDHNFTKLIEEYKKHESSLLALKFMTLQEYLRKLRLVCLALQPLHKRAAVYLAAAVSDFYVPDDKLPLHKIQSSESLALTLERTPKMLGHVAQQWAFNAFVVSFKLETDENILISKCRLALSNYGHQVVVGNLLETRYNNVIIVTSSSVVNVNATSENIEIKLISQLYLMHEQFMTS
uniref:Phosphopantothenate--cysteine ligase-like n=1 Tax=Ciona intestinalis TaxID=7719 RepID=A0A1W3JPF5_CIOIN|nr:phosphopantothenate--cysteine ligase-like [Ciona intestinalis]XP_009862015.1 phosphopantothenate--cysteine ligase-like [Ciona intestinalis]|eukprot:XP_002123168.1 phosphopantothenate--cysteine ligase-like [Ciona intestinalis]